MKQRDEERDIEGMGEKEKKGEVRKYKDRKDR